LHRCGAHGLGSRPIGAYPPVIERVDIFASTLPE
jgi:hypothetical protein